MKSIAKIFPYMENFTIIKQIFPKYIENHYPDVIFELNMIKYQFKSLIPPPPSYSHPNFVRLDENMILVNGITM